MTSIFPDRTPERVVYFLVSSFAIILFVPMAIGFTSIYPVDTILLRILKAITGTALSLVAQLAVLIWVWCLCKARWTKWWFDQLKNELVLTVVALTIFVGIWFAVGMK